MKGLDALESKQEDIEVVFLEKLAEESITTQSCLSYPKEKV